jgi:hypothetical protein
MVEESKHQQCGEQLLAILTAEPDQDGRVEYA